MTSEWYRQVLEKLPGIHVLDIGIGTGGALAKNAALVLRKNIKVTGIDYDEHYIDTCKETLRVAGLEKNIGNIEHASVYDYKGGPFDAAYFSVSCDQLFLGSLMIMPDPVGALNHVQTLLKPNSYIYITQTFEDKPFLLLEIVKPFLKYLLTIDFGQVVYERTFLEDVKKANLTVISNVALTKNHGRLAKIIVLGK